MSCFLRAWASRDMLSWFSVVVTVGTCPQVITMLAILEKDNVPAALLERDNVSAAHSFVISGSI